MRLVSHQAVVYLGLSFLGLQKPRGIILLLGIFRVSGSCCLCHVPVR